MQKVHNSVQIRIPQLVRSWTNAGVRLSRNLYQKLAWQIWRKSLFLSQFLAQIQWQRIV